jgi:peptide methionine sulfoxide reductase MsrB
VLLVLLLLQSVVRSDDEWRQVLSPGQYKILRQAGTELPRTR